LGLTFCKIVAEAHGGCIFVERNLPKGSIFTVEI
jgi:two-component system, sensor histidine kinase and response regulator